MANTKKQIKKIKAVESPAVKAWKTRCANLALAENAAKAKHAKRGAKKAGAPKATEISKAANAVKLGKLVEKFLKPEVKVAA